MDEVNDYCQFEESAQDLVRMIPLFVEGPWRVICGGRDGILWRLPKGQRQGCGCEEGKLTIISEKY